MDFLFCFQSNEVRSSCHMEKEGLVRAVRYFEDNGVAISHLITDRHLQVAKWVRENMPETTHYIDVWHVAKGKYMYMYNSQFHFVI